VAALYDAYEKLGVVNGQRALAEKFFLNGEFEYYFKLKNLYAPEKWAETQEQLLRVLQESRQWSTYVKVLIHDNRKDKLLAYRKNNSSKIDALSPHLLPNLRKGGCRDKACQSKGTDEKPHIKGRLFAVSQAEVSVRSGGMEG